MIDVESASSTDVGNAVREAVEEWARAEGLEAYDRGDAGRLPTAPRGAGGQEHRPGAGAAGYRPGRALRRDFLIETLTRFPEVRSIHWAVNDRAEVTNLPTRLLWGEPWIEEELLGLRFRVRPNAFLQTNTEMAETLYARP